MQLYLQHAIQYKTDLDLLLNPSSTLHNSHIHRTHLPIPLLSLGWRIGQTQRSQRWGPE